MRLHHSHVLSQNICYQLVFIVKVTFLIIQNFLSYLLCFRWCTPNIRCQTFRCCSKSHWWKVHRFKSYWRKTSVPTIVTYKKRSVKIWSRRQKILFTRKNVRKIITNLILESAVVLPLSGLLRVVESKTSNFFIYIMNDRTLL